MNELNIHEGKELCRELFPGFKDHYLFSTKFFIEQEIRDAWISPEGVVFPMKPFKHGDFEIAVRDFNSPILASVGWLRISAGDCFFQFSDWVDDRHTFLTQEQKDFLIDIMDCEWMELRNPNYPTSPKTLLEFNESLLGEV